MQLLKNIILGILLLVTLSIGGTVIGVAIGWNIDFPSSAFTQWRLVTSSIKFSKIVYVNTTEVWAQSTDGKLYSWKRYSCSTRDSATCGWGEAKDMPDDAYKDNFKLMSKGCPESEDPPKKTPGEIIECASTVDANPGGSFLTYFALLKNGTIWQWTPPSKTDVPVLSLCICPSTGFATGFSASIFLIYRWLKRRRYD
jgi:hypothetical protein